MYIFVFLWTPVLMPVHPPLGMVFATFMVAIMIGSSAYTLLLNKGYKAEDVLRITLLILAVAFGMCCFTAAPDAGGLQISVTYVCFILLEVAIGMYFPAMSYCKSQIIPESHRANVMNWFRVPMNIITCVTLLCLHFEWLKRDKRAVFATCFGLVAVGILLASKFIKTARAKPAPLPTAAEEAKQALLEEAQAL
jgi:hypothetical protein